MNDEVKRIDVGVVTAFAEAKRAATPYPYDRERFRQDLANLGTTAAEVEANRQAVAEDKAAVERNVTTVEEYKDAAAQSASEAAQSAENAHTDALAATAAKEAAQTAQGIAVEAKEAAAASKTAAESAQSEADTSAEAAAGSALVAQNAAQTATTQAGAASDSATAAAASATAAAESAQTLTIDTTLTQAGQAADAKKVGDEVTDLKSAVNTMRPTATASDVGKVLIVKTVDQQTGKPTSYEYGETNVPVIYALRLGTNWLGDGPYFQTVEVSGYSVTQNTKMDILLDHQKYMKLYEFGVNGIQTINVSGTISIYVYGERPTQKIDLNCCLQEVNFIQRLPSEYQEVTYIQSYGEQYIDTGVKSDQNTYFGLDMELTEIATNSQVMGHSSNKARCQIGHDDQVNFYFGCGSENMHKGILDTNRHVLYIDFYNRKIGIDDQEQSLPSYGVYNAGAQNLLLFARSDNTFQKQAHVFCKFYGCVIKSNDIKIANFVPCYKKSNGEIGLYDIIRNHFYANDGSGAFTKGEDV